MKSNKEKIEELELMNKEDAYIYLDGILRCVGRAKRLIELNGPMTVVRNEMRMIQHRAISALSCYEAHALMEFAKSEEKEPNQ